MTKADAVRAAAEKLHEAIIAARADGYHVEWPHRPEALPAIAVSETKKRVATVTVAAPAGTEPEAVAKAGVAAQRAADRVIDPPAKKG